MRLCTVQLAAVYCNKWRVLGCELLRPSRAADGGRPSKLFRWRKKPVRPVMDAGAVSAFWRDPATFIRRVAASTPCKPHSTVLTKVGLSHIGLSVFES